MNALRIAYVVIVVFVMVMGTISLGFLIANGGR